MISHDSEVSKFITDAINATVTVGGTLVDESEYQRRVSICSTCEKAGEVNVCGFKMQGCTLCGCPFATKPRYETYFSFLKMQLVTAECPHKEGNKWAIAAMT